jgi:hypothetical protein
MCKNIVCDMGLTQSYSIVLINRAEEMMSGVLRDVDDAEADGVDGDDAMELLETILSTIQSLLFQKA